MVELRLDDRVRPRADASDVVQEALLEAAERLREYLKKPEVPFFIWLRFLTAQRLQAAHRRHLGVRARDARREIRLHSGTVPSATSEALAAQLLGREAPPSEALLKTERRVRLEEALNTLEPLDREVIALRHFEDLSGREIAQILGLKEAAARQRYVRALKKLKEILAGLPGGLE
jgi:RNA polymerase sigma-70 factor (ECF subfamily)